MTSRRAEGSESQYYNRRDRNLVDEGELSTGSGPSLSFTPIERKGKWRQTFSLKGKGKERADTPLDSPLAPTTPHFSHIDSHLQVPLISSPSPVEISDTDTIRPDTIRPYESPKSAITPRSSSAMESYVMVDTKPENGSDSDSSYVLVSQRRDSHSSRPKRRASNRVGSLDISVNNLLPKPKASSAKGSLKRPVIRTKVTALSAPESPKVSQSSGVEDTGAVPPAPIKTHASQIPVISLPKPRLKSIKLSVVTEVTVQATPPGAYIQEPADQHKPDTVINSTACPSDDDPSSCEPANLPRDISGEAVTAAGKSQPRELIDIDLMRISDVVKYLGDHGCRNLSTEVSRQTAPFHPMQGGSLCDLNCDSMRDGSIVAIKTMRSLSASKSVLKHAAQQLMAWSKCEHPNVIKLVGLATVEEDIMVISPWFKKGNIRKYLVDHPNTDRYRLAAQVCQGLKYLHGMGIVHGSLQGSNVLISEDETPLITDVGHAMLKKYSIEITYANVVQLCSPRWTAPEILRGQTTYSTVGDIYALGMTILEILTGKLPFHNLADHTFLCAILFGSEVQQPERPTEQIPTASEYGDELWKFLTQCWLHEADKRPSATAAADSMETISHKKLNNT